MKHTEHCKKRMKYSDGKCECLVRTDKKPKTRVEALEQSHNKHLEKNGHGY